MEDAEVVSSTLAGDAITHVCPVPARGCGPCAVCSSAKLVRTQYRSVRLTGFIDDRTLRARDRQQFKGALELTATFDALTGQTLNLEKNLQNRAA